MTKNGRTLVVTVLVMVLALSVGCSSPSAEPLPTTDIDATVEARMSATLTAMPDPTDAPVSAPTAMPMPASTATLMPAPTATAMPTATPTPRPTATPIPTPTPTPKPTATPTPIPTLSDMVERVRPSVVLVQTDVGHGSGVIFDSDGRNAWIVTNHHVIAGSSRINVIVNDSYSYDAEVLGYDSYFDLAVLWIQCSSCKDVPFGRPRDLKSGMEVVVIGYPGGGVSSEASVTRGIISAIGPQSYYQRGDVIQTDAAINPGNSGGPMFSLNGQVIGINTFKSAVVNVESQGFAIPVGTVREQVTRLEQGVFEFGFEVKPWNVYPIEFYLQTGAKLTYKFQSDSDVNFRIYDPDGVELLFLERVFSAERTFTAKSNGIYTLEWDNRFSIFTSKNVRFYCAMTR